MSGSLLRSKRSFLAEYTSLTSLRQRSAVRSSCATALFAWVLCRVAAATAGGTLAPPSEESDWRCFDFLFFLCFLCCFCLSGLSPRSRAASLEAASSSPSSSWFTLSSELGSFLWPSRGAVAAASAAAAALAARASASASSRLRATGVLGSSMSAPGGDPIASSPASSGLGTLPSWRLAALAAETAATAAAAAASARADAWASPPSPLASLPRLLRSCSAVAAPAAAAAAAAAASSAASACAAATTARSDSSARLSAARAPASLPSRCSTRELIAASSWARRRRGCFPMAVRAVTCELAASGATASTSVCEMA
mmetsp:Transcript_5854/g.24638  ORF Transcript_5854/g.24638 Transcript_5854/m.24638 type:complete len:313 (+) Transcript_5854:1059-1997(+)